MFEEMIGTKAVGDRQRFDTDALAARIAELMEFVGTLKK